VHCVGDVDVQVDNKQHNFKGIPGSMYSRAVAVVTVAKVYLLPVWLVLAKCGVVSGTALSTWSICCMPCTVDYTMVSYTICV
jgi:hypothetical protein